MKNIHLFYFSPTHTTKRTLQGIGKGFGREVIEHDLTFACENDEVFNLGENDIAIIGVPVYAGRVPEIATNILKRVHGNNTLAVVIVVYGNRAFENALLELKNILKENGFSVIAGGAFIGEHSYTKKVGTKRPDNNDIEIAINFGKKIDELVRENSYKNDIEVPGNFPYKDGMPKMSFAPMANDNCIYCRKCWSVCPVGAIDQRKPDIVQVEKCIRCYACVKVCTFDGREIPNNPLEKIINYLETNCTDRKEPELFY